MHPRIKKKYFNNLLIIRIGDFHSRGLRAVEFLPKHKVEQEIEELQKQYPMGYKIRVFDITDREIKFDD
jgi:hypothetical protein